MAGTMGSCTLQSNGTPCNFSSLGMADFPSFTQYCLWP